MKRSLAIVVGTRPEIIKCALLPGVLRERTNFSPLVIFAGQHRELAEEAFSNFGLAPDLSLELMKADQQPLDFLALLLPRLRDELQKLNVAGVVVQGDTMTTLGAALAAFHLQIPVVHLEAGLRSDNIYSPFPEEMNRMLVSRIAAIHFAPTVKAKAKLEDEGITKDVYVVGNTGVDAALLCRQRLEAGQIKPSPAVFEICQEEGPILLVTGHRRENLATNLGILCEALLEVKRRISDLRIVFPVHLNPSAQKVVSSYLAEREGIYLLPALSYPSLISLLARATLVITDSGGIQEEAPSFNKFVLVSRAETERPEAVELGYARLLSAKAVDSVAKEIEKELERRRVDSGERMENPFGDGRSTLKIADILQQSSVLVR